MPELFKVIRYEGPADVLVYKHPNTDFPAGSQLIVHESQEAIFFRNGQILDSFEAGRYTLDSEYFPKIGREFKRVFGKESIFHAEIYFVNKTDCMTVLWGTASPMLIQDPIYDVILPVRANGQFTVRVENARKLLSKLIGTIERFDVEILTYFFRGLLMNKIKDYIARIISINHISFLQIHSYLSDISQVIHKKIEPNFLEYGLFIPTFYVNSITIPEDDPSYQRIKGALAAAKEKELLAKGKKAEMDILGYTYQQERTFDVLDKAAQNEGNASNVMGIGMGLGMGVPLGNTFASLGQTAFLGVNKCPNCNATLSAGAKFCSECGQQIMNQSDNLICPNCGQKILPGKFCLYCGHKLTKICPDCGTETAANGRFCPECGYKF